MNRRRVAAFAALWAGVTAAALFIPACYGRNCEGGLQTYGADGGEGRMVSDTVWESSPQNGDWLWFPRQRYYVFSIPALNGRAPVDVSPFLSAQPSPNGKSGGNFTTGAGNIALLANATANRVDVINDTCSDYYLRLVVHVAPMPPESPAPTAEAGAPDAAPTPTETPDAGDPDASAAP